MILPDVTGHSPNCRWPTGEPCRKFSTDGTRLGAQIAHTMGTTDEDEIANMAETTITGAARASLTGMIEEQADWEEDDE